MVMVYHVRNSYKILFNKKENLPDRHVLFKMHEIIDF